MSDIDRDELRRLLAGATPGPWEAEGSQVWGPDGVLVAAVRKHSMIVDRPDALIIAAAVNALPDLMENPRDEYHTMEELYDYRMLYNALAANAMPDLSCKSWRHSDGEKCFGGDWFVVYMTLPSIGQVSNHYRAEHWDLFHVPEVERAPEYDGHTPQDAAERLRQAARDGLPAVLPDLLAQAWEEGHRASERDWEMVYNLSTPDEDRQPWTNPYRQEG